MLLRVALAVALLSGLACERTPVTPAEGCAACLAAGGCVCTLAGMKTTGFRDGVASEAQFDFISAIAYQGEALIIADMGNARIRMLKDGVMTTIAGGGPEPPADGPALAVSIGGPRGLAVLADGRILFSNYRGRVIRCLEHGQIKRVAGVENHGGLHFNGPALQATFGRPQGLAVGPADEVYIADNSDNTIRLLRGAGSAEATVDTVAGEHGIPGHRDGAAASARFFSPIGLATLGADIFISDHGNHAIRKLSTDQVTTIAGSGIRTIGVKDGPAAEAEFGDIDGLAAHASGRIYVAENYSTVLRMIEGGQVTTIAGAVLQLGSVDGPLDQARFHLPSALALDPHGNVVVGETSSVRLVVLHPVPAR